MNMPPIAVVFTVLSLATVQPRIGCGSSRLAVEAKKFVSSKFQAFGLPHFARTIELRLVQRIYVNAPMNEGGFHQSEGRAQLTVIPAGGVARRLVEIRVVRVR